MIADSIDIVGTNAQYDEACKKLLASREILAWILKEVTEEFRDYDVKEIAEKYIEGQPEVASRLVNPGETNAGILGLNNENTIYKEGKITYDVHFQAIYPEGNYYVKIFVNVEAQKDFYPGYAISKRGLFYCCRMISAQYQTEFTEPDYDNIKKVYSIWICMNPSKAAGNTIVKYAIQKEDVVGKLSVPVRDYDIMTMVMICLGGEKSKDYKGILKLLDVLFSKEKNAKEKKYVLEHEFGIEMTKQMEKEVHVVCNLSEGLVEEVTEEVTQKVESRFSRLILLLLAEKRYGELEQASRDREFREKLFAELGIE